MAQHDDQGPPDGATRSGQPRISNRSRLPIPVRVKIGLAPSRESRLRDVSVTGFAIEWSEPAATGDMAILRFEGYPEVCPSFVIGARVVRVITGKDPGLGLVIDREGSPPEALANFRKLVLHYMRHKPLLDELVRDFFEGRCEACEWIGRVGARAPVCPRCGERVRQLDSDQ